jgi:iron-sulfur cluster repair protein YtfE (RIC family)
MMVHHLSESINVSFVFRGADDGINQDINRDETNHDETDDKLEDMEAISYRVEDEDAAKDEDYRAAYPKLHSSSGVSGVSGVVSG